MTIKPNYQKVKAVMGIDNDYMDDVILPLIDVVTMYAYQAGVPIEELESDNCVGLLATGTKDLFDYGNAGDQKFSKLFDLMLIQHATR